MATKRKEVIKKLCIVVPCLYVCSCECDACDLQDTPFSSFFSFFFKHTCMFK